MTPENPAITQLIVEPDMAEQVRDQIAAILTIEAKGQQNLASSADKDQHTFDVYSERGTPWAQYMDATEPLPPTINVTLETEDYDMSQSTIIGEFAKSRTTFNIDCYGHGIGSDDPSEPGHVASDKMGAFEARRAARFVRRVLMDSRYMRLGYPDGVIHQRWVSGIQMLRPSMEGREFQQVCAARVVLDAHFNEQTPLVEGEILESIGVTVKRKATGEIYFTAEF